MKTLISKSLSGAQLLKGELRLSSSIQGNLENKATNTFYDSLREKPRINGIVLTGNKSSSELELQEAMETITNLEIQKIWKEGRLK